MRFFYTVQERSFLRSVICIHSAYLPGRALQAAGPDPFLHRAHQAKDIQIWAAPTGAPFLNNPALTDKDPQRPSSWAVPPSRDKHLWWRSFVLTMATQLVRLFIRPAFCWCYGGGLVLLLFMEPFSFCVGLFCLVALLVSFRLDAKLDVSIFSSSLRGSTAPAGFLLKSNHPRVAGQWVNHLQGPDDLFVPS